MAKNVKSLKHQTYDLFFLTQFL